MANQVLIFIYLLARWATANVLKDSSKTDKAILFASNIARTGSIPAEIYSFLSTSPIPDALSSWWVFRGGITVAIHSFVVLPSFVVIPIYLNQQIGLWKVLKRSLAVSHGLVGNFEMSLEISGCLWKFRGIL